MRLRRPLKVYGWRWQDGTGRYREIAAARDIQHVRRILGSGPTQAVELGIVETDDPCEREIALAAPGTVFRSACGSAFHRR